MAADLEFRPLADVPTRDVLDLLRRCLGEGPRRSERFWNWKHLENPFGPSPGLVAFAGETLVGVRVFMPWQLTSADRTFRVVRAVDTATHPDWRRIGLFRRLTEAMVRGFERQGFDFIFNTPNARSRQGYLTMGWGAVGKMSVLFRPGSLRRWLGGTGTVNGVPLGESRLRPLEALLDDPRLALFLERLSGPEPRLHTRRSVDFLRWRYQAMPASDYFAAWDLDDSGRGSVIVGRCGERRGRRELLLSEVLVSDASVAKAAAKQIRGLARLVSPHYVVAMAAPRTVERGALGRAGFLPVPRGGPYLTARRLGKPDLSPDPAVLGSWRLALGDLEVF